jgi:competence ComEA-like helix-hairpin-helix protein
MSAPARGGFLLLGRFIAVTGLNYLLVVALAWLLPPGEFGKVAVLQAILLLAAMVLNSGFPWTLTWTLAGSHSADEAARVFRTSLLGNALFAALLALALVAVERLGLLGFERDFGGAVITAAITFPFFALSGVGRGALHGSRRFGGIALMQTGEAIVRAAVGLSLVAVVGMNAQGVAAAFLVAAIFASTSSAWLLRDILPGWGGLAPVSTYVRTLPIFATVAGVALLLTLDVLTLNAVGEAAGVTAATVGLYQAAATLARAPYFVGDALLDAVFPYMVLRKDSPGRSHGYFSAAVRWVALVVLPVDLVLAVWPEPFLALFFPTSYGGAATLVRLLAVGSIGAVGVGVFGKALQALGKRTAAAAGTIGALVIEISLIAALVPSAGAEGAATAFGVGAWSGALFLGMCYFRYQNVPLPRVRWLGRYACSFALISAFSVAGFYFHGDLALLWVLVAALAYIGSLLFLRLVTVSELHRLASVLVALIPLRRLEAGAARLAGSLRGVALWLALRPRLALGLVAALASFAVIADNVTRSPDTVYDEVVYTEAARNVVTDGDLTWSGKPLFVHPPLYFLVQGAWLRLNRSLHTGIFETIHEARYLTAAFTALVVCMVALFAYEFAASAARRRRLLLAGGAAFLAAFDPILLRFGRLGMLESLATLFGLVTLYVAWRWRGRSATAWIGGVGLLAALSLLVKEITIFLLIVPLLFSILRRDARLAGRSLAALAVGIVGWATFVGWAFALGLQSRFAEDKLATGERLLGILQLTGWNRPTVSFVEALRVSAPQYFPSYFVLACGAAALCWLWLRRSGDVAAYLTAWLASTYAFGAYTVARGQLNEQFFTYLMPGAIVATVLLADATFVWATQPRSSPPGRLLRRWQLAAAAPVAALVLASSASAVNWWRLYHDGGDQGVERITAFARHLGPRCTAFNASGDVEKYASALSGHPVTGLGSGPLAASRGVRYFFFSPKDVWARYGKMNPDLEAWLRRFGKRVASYPSHTYWGVQLWHVGFWPFDPIADIQPIPGGVFVNVRGSACGGYPVVNNGDGAFVRTYQELGGKPRLGRPRSRAWKEHGRAFQLFDTLLLASRLAPSDVRRSVAPVKLVTMLSKLAPWTLTAHDLPRPEDPPARTLTEARPLLTDGLIASAYLGTAPAAATGADWARAVKLWGAPVGRPHRYRRSFLRQPFERVVFERRVGDPRYRVRLARTLGQAALDAGVVPARERKLLPVPNLTRRQPPNLRSSIRPFLILFSSFLVALALATAALAVIRRRPVPTVGVLELSHPRPRRAPAGGIRRPPVVLNGKVSLNSATAQELTTLPGIGAATATRILAYRDAHGAFVAVADLRNVPGIGPARFRRVEELVEP